MPKRINAIPTTASAPAADDYFPLDGGTNGTRKLLASFISGLTNSRASRQGLWMDGASVVTYSPNISSQGTGDYFVSGYFNTPSFAVNNIMCGGGLWTFDFPSATVMRHYDNGTSYNITVPALAVDTVYHYAWARIAGVLYGYINGVLMGSVACTNSLLAFETLGVGAAAQKFRGNIVPPYIANRGFIAAEVLALYQEGAPRAADYNNASNTAINLATTVNDANAAADYDTFSGASASGFTAIKTGTANESNAYSGTDIVLSPGQSVRVSFSCALTSGTLPALYLSNVGRNLFSNPSAQIVAGSNSIILTCTTAATNARVRFYNATADLVNYAISGLSVTRLGLLCAPDADAPGLGSVWKDVSGAATPADLILPSSGVSWVKPGDENWLRASRSSNGYLVADQIVVPLNCMITEIWVKTTAASLSIYSDSIPTATVATISPTSGVWFKYTGVITQTPSGKLYVGLGSAVLTEIKVKYVRN